MRGSRWAAIVILTVAGPFHMAVTGNTHARALEDEGMEVVMVEHDQPVTTLCPSASSEGSDDTYSVIVVSNTPQRSNLFRDKGRMCAYSTGVASVQIANVNPEEPFQSNFQPFFVGHPSGVSHRVRIYHTGNYMRYPYEASHVDAACKDTSERTLILLTDEFCSEKPLTSNVPSACWSNMARHYPFNPSSPAMEVRHAYIPLGPRNTFPFVEPSRRSPASERQLLFNVAVSDATAPRRHHLVNLTSAYRTNNPAVGAFVNDRSLGAQDYQQLLLNSTFTMCPGGHNPETYRLFETLEAGSIPIVSRRDFMYPSFRAPFPCGQGNASWNTVAASPFAQAVSVGSWDDVPDLLDRVRTWSKEDLDKLQADSVAWYEALMRRTYKSLLNFGQGYELWPQNGPIVLDGFPAPSKPYGFTPPYDPDEI